MPIYKYISEKYLARFVNNGEVLFSSLSFFQRHEDATVRGDPYEGTRVFRPADGLTVTKVRTSETFQLPMAFEATAQTDHIFIFCASMRLDLALAQEFQVDACVEIVDLTAFVSRIRSALSRRPRVKLPKTLLHQAVTYYDRSTPPIVDWALPEKIAFSKPMHYSHQEEYRFAFSVC